MSEKKNFLSDFKVTQAEVDDFLFLLFQNSVSLNYEGYISIENVDKETSKHLKSLHGKEKANLIMMYLAFTLSLELRHGRCPRKSDWKKIRRLEQLFLDRTKTKEMVPPEVMAIAHVIYHYWAYLS